MKKKKRPTGDRKIPVWAAGVTHKPDDRKSVLDDWAVVQAKEFVDTNKK